MRHLLRAVVAVAAAAFAGAAVPSQRYDPSPEVVSAWNELVNDQIVTAPSNVNSNYGTRILAAVHVAQYQAVDQLLREYGLTWKSANPYKIKVNNLENPLVNAVAAAAKTVLLGKGTTAGIYPSVVAGPVNTLYATQTADPDTEAIAIGEAQGLAVLASRVNDGTSPNVVTDFGNSAVNGAWRNTSASPALNPQWATSRPWAIQYPGQFRAPLPPSLSSAQYRADYDEVKSVGGTVSSTRTQAQADTANFWRSNIEFYFNQAVRQVVAKRSFIEAVRFFAVTAIAGADARVAGWDTKFTYSTWRPVSSIPLGNGVGFPADPSWTSFIATPSHPEYISGHTSAGAAYAEALWLLTGKDKVTITITPPAAINLPARTYTSFSEANLENAVSRIYGGVHFRFSNVEAAPLGVGVGRAAYQFIYGQGAKIASQSQGPKILELYGTYV